MRHNKIGFVVGLTAEARILDGCGFLVAVGGGSSEGAMRAAEALIVLGAEALISFGLAGGLAPEWRPGEIIIPETVREYEDIYECDPDLLTWLGGANTAAMLADKYIAETASQKAGLFQKFGAAAVDMESGAVARVATAATVPFAVLRAIADPSIRDLPPAALVALNSAGRIGLTRVITSIVRRPGQLPSLLALAGDAAAARKTLRQKVQTLP
jgi:adenosylhomocysteine nucleosidase